MFFSELLILFDEGLNEAKRVRFKRKWNFTSDFGLASSYKEFHINKCEL